MAAVDALLNGERIVRQVVVDHERTELKIEALGGNVRGNQDFRVFLKALHDGIVAGAAAVVDQHLALVGAAVQESEKKVLRGPVFGENKHLLPCAKLFEPGETFFQADKQFFGLGVLFDVGGKRLHLSKFSKFRRNELVGRVALVKALHAADNAT